MTTFACVWVRGHVPFTAEYVARLREMVRANYVGAHHFVCLTDQPELLPDIETIPIMTPKGMFAWWAKLQLFNPLNGLTGRVVYLDLDTLIVGDLASVAEYPAPFALIPHAGDFNGKGLRKVVKRFNSSVMVWDAGQYDALYTTWLPSVTERLWGDQCYLGEKLGPEAAIMPLEWFPRISEIGAAGKVSGDTKVILAKKPKNSEAANIWPWVRAVWGKV